MSNPADTGTSREGDPYAEIAALTERVAELERERDEWKRKYEVQCAGSMSAHERRIHLEADLSALRAELERTQAVVDAARKLDLDREDNNDGRAVGHWDASAEDALNAALEKVNDHEQ